MLRLSRDISSAAGGEHDVGELRLGAINSALIGLLPDLLSSLRRKRPGIDLYIVPGQSAGLYNMVQKGDLDGAILVEPHFKIPKMLEWLPIREEPLIVLAPATMSESDPRVILKNEPFIRYDRNHWGGRLADHYLRKMRIVPREQYELDSLEAISVLVDRGLGVSLVPDWPPPWPQGIRVRKIPVVGAPVRRIGLVWPRMSPRLRLLQSIQAEMKGLFALPARSKGARRR
jgi:DNA-binding transcriptional LysR family regulator